MMLSDYKASETYMIDNNGWYQYAIGELISRERCTSTNSYELNILICCCITKHKVKEITCNPDYQVAKESKIYKFLISNL